MNNDVMLVVLKTSQNGDHWVLGIILLNDYKIIIMNSLNGKNYLNNLCICKSFQFDNAYIQNGKHRC